MKPQIRALLTLAAFTVPLAACPGGTQGFAFVSSVNGAYQPEGPVGSTFIVEGIQFGDVQGSSNVYFTNNLGVTALPAPITTWANNFIIGTVPTGAMNGPVSVNNGNGPNIGLTFFTVTPQAPFNPTALAWAAASALPVGLSGHAVAFSRIGNATSAPRVIYVTGGADSYSTVPASGAIGAWTATTALPTGLAFHAAVVATSANTADNNQTGYLLVIGGATSASGTSSAAIYRGILNTNGSVASWSQSASLPAALHSLAATIYMGHLYVVGGAGSGNTAVATVYRAVIQPDGTLGAWTSETSLPFRLSHFGFGQFNGRLYTFGGDSGQITPNDSLPSASAVTDIYSAPVDLFSRNLTTWSKSATSLPAKRMAETAVLAGAPGAGRILVSGGLVTGGPTDEELSASINADGSVAAFSTAASTISALCAGCSIFNHAATGYVNTNGEFHAVVVGGDDQNAPTKKRKESSTY
jgi:hypothetical protein